jgi:hypothetical protein
LAEEACLLFQSTSYAGQIEDDEGQGVSMVVYEQILLKLRIGSKGCRSARSLEVRMVPSCPEAQF